MATKEEMIICSSCGAEMKKNQRCCIKCGQLNYSHPENASMLKFAKVSNNNKPYVVGNGKLLGKNSKFEKSGEDNFSYAIATKAGDRRNCLVVNFCLLIVAISLLFLKIYNTGDAILDVLTSTSFNVMFMVLLILFLESISMQFLYMKANKPWWSFFVPFYNWYVYFDIAMNKGLLFLILFIPIVGAIFFFVSLYKLGKKFSYSGVFSLLLCPIALPVMAFNTAAAYEDTYYISSNCLSNNRALEKEYKSNKSIILFIFVLLFINVIVLIYFNLAVIVDKFDRLRFIYDSGQILELGKNDILESDYFCDNGFNINNEGTYYVMFDGDKSNFKGDVENISEYTGYIKIVTSSDKKQFLISIYNNRFGIEDASLSSLKKFNVEVKNTLKVKEPTNIIKCYKN